MKNKFSTKWKRSKLPRKQRKYIAKAPLHIKGNLLSANLSKELRKKYSRRSLRIRKGDLVKIMKGSFKKKQGKITEVDVKRMKIYIDGIQIKKKDGSKVNIPVNSSNLQIIELNLDDKERMNSINKEKTQKVGSIKKTEKQIQETKKEKVKENKS